MNGKSLLYPLRRLHGIIHEVFDEPSLICRGLIRSLKSSPKTEADYPVDIVVTWVDGGDPKWQAKKAMYTQDTAQSKDGVERYRDWEIFRFWFRAVEQYAPWVRKVFLITDDQVPDFINLSCEKLVVVDHRDIIDNAFLPVFNSCAIEANMYKIPDLSEHFIYFNDDVFLSRPVTVSDFFCGGLPRYTAQARPLHPPYINSLHAHQVMTSAGLINRTFDIKKQIKDHPEKWFSRRNKAAIKHNRMMYHYGYISGFSWSHLGVPYLKSTWETVAAKFSKEFQETSSHRFRSCFDVVHYIVIMWEMMTAHFEPVKHKYYGQSVDTYRVSRFDIVLDHFREKNNMMICLNDSDGLDYKTFLQQKEQIKDVFLEVFPEKSSFEK